MFALYWKNAALVFSAERTTSSSRFYAFNILFWLFFRFYVRLQTDRILLYSEFANVIAIAALPNLIREKHLRTAVRLAVIFVAAFYWYQRYIVIPLYKVWPYRSIL